MAISHTPRVPCLWGTAPLHVPFGRGHVVCRWVRTPPHGDGSCVPDTEFRAFCPSTGRFHARSQHKNPPLFPPHFLPSFLPLLFLFFCPLGRKRPKITYSHRPEM